LGVFSLPSGRSEAPRRRREPGPGGRTQSLGNRRTRAAPGRDAGSTARASPQPRPLAAEIAGAARTAERPEVLFDLLLAAAGGPGNVDAVLAEHRGRGSIARQAGPMFLGNCEEYFQTVAIYQTMRNVQSMADDELRELLAAAWRRDLAAVSPVTLALVRRALTLFVASSVADDTPDSGRRRHSPRKRSVTRQTPHARTKDGLVECLQKAVAGAEFVADLGR
jgi:hypothetical protein